MHTIVTGMVMIYSTDYILVQTFKAIVCELELLDSSSSEDRSEAKHSAFITFVFNCLLS